MRVPMNIKDKMQRAGIALLAGIILIRELPKKYQVIIMLIILAVLIKIIAF